MRDVGVVSEVAVEGGGVFGVEVADGGVAHSCGHGFKFGGGDGEVVLDFLAA